MTAAATAPGTGRAKTGPGIRQVLLLAPAGLLLGVLLAGPLAMLLPYGFLPNRGMRTSFDNGLTLANYAIVLGDSFYLAMLARTLAMSVCVTVASVLIGWPLAYFLWHTGPRWKSLASLAVVAPLLVSIPVRNYGWMVILGDHGLINVALMGAGLLSEPIPMMYTDAAVVIGLTHVLMPFVVLSVLASLDQMSPNLSEAAEPSARAGWK